MNWKEWLLVAVLIIIGIVGWHYYLGNQRKLCEDFARSKGCTIVRYDTHVTTIGTPYYYINKNTVISEVKLSNGQVWFMRPNIFGPNDWEQLKK